MNTVYHKSIFVISLVGLLCASSAISADETQSAVSNTIAEKTKEYLSDPARTGSIVGSIIAGSALANPLAPLLGSVVGFIIGKSSAFSKEQGGTQRSNAYSNRSLIPDSNAEVTNLTGLTSASSLETQPADGGTILVDMEAGSRQGATINLGLAENAVADNEQEIIPVLAAARGSSGDNGSNQIVIVESMDQRGVSKPLVATDLVREADLGITPAHLAVQGLSGESTPSTDLQKMLADACSNAKTVKPTSLNCYYNAQ